MQQSPEEEYLHENKFIESSKGVGSKEPRVCPRLGLHVSSVIITAEFGCIHWNRRKGLGLFVRPG